MIILVLALAVSSGVNASAHTELHLMHGSFEAASASTRSDVHNVPHQHNQVDHDAHHHGSHEQDGEKGDHGHEEHASQYHGCAIEVAQGSERHQNWLRTPNSFESDRLLPDPLFLAEHIPD